MRLSGLRLRYRQSLVAVPSLYVVAACLLGVLMPALDRARDAESPQNVGVGAARDILGATATGMIAFTGFVVAGLLVVVQFAAAQYSPRLVLWFRRDTLVKHAIGIFLAAFVYALVALWRLESDVAGFSPDITVTGALLLLVGACVLFLALLQRVTDRLRPRTLYGAVIRQGLRAAHETWPELLGDDAPLDRSWATADPQRVALEGRPGVVTSIDRPALVAAAARAGAVIELVPAVGEFVGARGELLRIHGARLEPGSVRGLVHLADERTIELDPAFAVRIVVDTAIRALSPAVNDPTTAVQGLDVLELLVREASTATWRPPWPTTPPAGCAWCGGRRAGRTCSTSPSRRSATTAAARCRSAAACARCCRTSSPRRPSAATPPSRSISGGSTPRSTPRSRPARPRATSRWWRTAPGSASRAAELRPPVAASPGSATGRSPPAAARRPARGRRTGRGRRAPARAPPSYAPAPAARRSAR